MNTRQRVALAVTGLALTVLAGVFSFLSWDRANNVAGVVSALLGVAALGASAYAALSGSREWWRVSNTGNGRSSRGSVNTGIERPASEVATGGPMNVDSSGSAQSDEGDVNTGIKLR
ncbi:hypothetical protein ACIGBH_41960 [Streptomyces sp. NPDC085929]|uniref:hypothetical protein n=1 Tax=Streptomyces sp. NPDC085929 TaxID=3365739 RepID=UPI0037CD2D83